MLLVAVMSFLGVCRAENEHGIMRPSPRQLREWLESYRNAPLAPINNTIKPRKGSLSLLAQLPYIPAERDQGMCGNCWTWAGTGVMEIAHSVNNNVHDRLSIQYINSCGTNPDGDYACCGGLLDYFAQR